MKRKDFIVNPNTRITALLEADQEGVINMLVKLNSNFSKLRNPVLRKLFASRVTIASACKIANCKVEDFLHCMEQVGFKIGNADAEKLPQKNGIDLNRKAKVLELDARPYLEKDQDPLKVILQYIKRIGPGERLKIINTFEPVPLINLLSDKGFLHHTEVLNENLVITWFEINPDWKKPTDGPEYTAESSAGSELFYKVLGSFLSENIRYVDVRQLEMPKPMLLITENLERLKEGELLYVYHKKVPVFLLPELEKRGFKFLFNHKSDTGVDILIYRP